MSSNNTNEKAIVVVRGLKKYFPIKSSFFKKTIGNVKAVDNVSFEIKPGTTFGVVGESGCGKTTMGRTMLRLYPITEGEVLYRGLHFEKLTAAQLRRALPSEEKAKGSWDKKALVAYFEENGININLLSTAALNKLRPDIQIIFQDPYSSLSPRLPIGDIIGEAVKEHKIVPKDQYEDYISDIMKSCGLQEYHKDRYPHEFSGGQRQRICIARALAMNPKLVVCDEPVSALDVSIQAQIINLLKDLQKERGLTYIFISHDLSVVQHISDQIAVMYLGSMVELASKEDLFASPMHPYTQALLSAIPVPDPDVKMNRIVLEGDLPSPANPPKGCKFHTRCAKCTERCKNEAPAFREYAPGHFVACHLYDTEDAAPEASAESETV
ncbi:MAG: ATP-binding cassette domain-containing protein [Ruminococcaceae bacterium]|nr:ATP-binding cassette domain-containing protein [Oscillospiraceae bacterium]